MFIIGVQDADGVLHVNSLAGDEKVAASGIKRVKIRKSLVRGDGVVPDEAAHLFVIVIFFSIILRDRPRRTEICGRNFSLRVAKAYSRENNDNVSSVRTKFNVAPARAL